MKADGNTQIAEDTTATTFMKAFENINKFSTEKKESSFAAWLYNIAYHSLLDIHMQDYRSILTRVMVKISVL